MEWTELLNSNLIVLMWLCQERQVDLQNAHEK